MLHSIAFEIDTDASSLSSITSAHLASAWHIAQANPAPYGDKDAGLLVKALGDEIVRRWLAAVPAQLYSHQAIDHDRKAAIDDRRMDSLAADLGAA